MQEFDFSQEAIFVCDRLDSVSDSVDDDWSLTTGERGDGKSQREFLFVADRVVTQYADSMSRKLFSDTQMYFNLRFSFFAVAEKL